MNITYFALYQERKIILKNNIEGLILFCRSDIPLCMYGTMYRTLYNVYNVLYKTELLLIIY